MHDRLNFLSITNIENDILDCLSFKDVIKVYREKIEYIILKKLFKDTYIIVIAI